MTEHDTDIPRSGLVAVVKRDCPTCVLVSPVLADLAARADLVVVSQDDPGFPEGLRVVDDTDLGRSLEWNIETVPTVVHLEEGRETARVEGWSREAWERLTGIDGLGTDLPAFRPGCGSLTLDPGRAEEILVRRHGDQLSARRIEISELEDEFEAAFDRGWTDGLPVVPPTEARVLRMLEGTSRAPDEVVAIVPPDLVECTVEKVAINAVMAGCRPEHLPVVLAAVEAACTEEFNMHGLLCTTYFSGPMVVVSGPVVERIGMNSGINAMGQGNRANATIGRALQLVVRNVGGGRPGEVDRATLGNPGKYTFCFAEAPPPAGWATHAESLGFAPEESCVTLFAGEGVRGFVDQLSREPDSLVAGLAENLRTGPHPKLAIAFDVAIVLSPEHLRVLLDAGWDRARLEAALRERLTFPGSDLVAGAGGMAEGMPDWLAGADLPKYRDGGMLFFHAGGGAGLFSAVVGGWAGGSLGSTPVTRPVTLWA